MIAMVVGKKPIDKEDFKTRTTIFEPLKEN